MEIADEAVVAVTSIREAVPPPATPSSPPRNSLPFIELLARGWRGQQIYINQKQHIHDIHTYERPTLRGSAALLPLPPPRRLRDAFLALTWGSKGVGAAEPGRTATTLERTTELI